MTSETTNKKLADMRREVEQIARATSETLQHFSARIDALDILWNALIRHLGCDQALVDLLAADAAKAEAEANEETVTEPTTETA